MSADLESLPAAGRPAGASSPEPRDGLAEALEVIGDRWSLVVVASLLEGPLRFGELQERLPAISPNILSQRLRALQASGLVLATPYSRRPPRFAYELTSAGAELAGALRMLSDWGARLAGATAEPPRHEACETPLELRWYCPTCEEPLADPAQDPVEELYFA
jgi:DNA-binding HxlR family transcriptional regulator